MASARDFDVERIVDHGAVVVILYGQAGEGRQHVEPRELGGVELYGMDILGHLAYQFGVEARLDDGYLLLGAEYLLLVDLELLGDIPLGVDERLLADPLLGHLVAVCVGHLDIVAEHVVVAYLEARDPSRGALAGLYLQEIVLAGVGYVAQFVELRVDPLADHRTAVERYGRVVAKRARYGVARSLAGIELLAYGMHSGLVGAEAYVPDRA